MVGTLVIPIRISCFESVHNKHHLFLLINKNVGYYCYNCKCMVAFKSQPCISYKIKHESGEAFDYVFHDLGSNLCLVMI